jgi:type VI secretion system secreted protein VgrG
MERLVDAVTPFGSAMWFREMTGVEAISSLFDFDVSFHSKQSGLSAKTILGKPVTLKVETEGGGVRPFNGICTRFANNGREGEHHVYSAKLRPWLWLASRRSDCKIFQFKKVPDIIEEVLARYGFPIKKKLTRSYRQWDYCVQYQETDMNFVMRLMEHEGIYFFFEHAEGTHTLVMADDMASHASLPGKASIKYYGVDAATVPDEEHINSWAVREEADSGEYFSIDYDFEKPKADLKAMRSKPMGHSHDSYQQFDWPGGYVDVGVGENYAGIRLEMLESEHERATGTCTVRTMAPGYRFNLERCPRADQNREYLSVGVTYYFRDNARMSSGSGDGDATWEMKVTAQPSSLPYRAQMLTPKPRTTGPDRALVVGPPGEEIYTDKYGRVKVQFYWDRYGKKNENSSCWLRVSQPWAGTNYGGIFTPRIGQEVIVDFICGDPDYPMITGRVYNADQMPPWELPKHKTQSGFQTRSSKGGGGRHMLRFEDKKGIEHIELSTTYGQTHLHMGYLMNQGSEAKRSYGFELRTHEWGSVRADKGLLLTTYTQDYTQKISHDNPDGHESLGSALSATEALTKQSDQARALTADTIGAVIKNKGQVIASTMSAVAGGGGGGGGGGENAMPTGSDPAMSDSKRMHGLTQKVGAPIVSIVSPEGHTLISPKPVVVSSGQSTSIHAASHVTIKTGAQLTQLAQGGMYTHVASGGQVNVVTGGDIASFAQAGAMNLLAKQDATLASMTTNANVIGEQSVVISGNTDAVFVKAAQKIVLQCGGSSIVMLSDGTIEIKGDKGILNFGTVLDQKGGKILLNC